MFGDLRVVNTPISMLYNFSPFYLFFFLSCIIAVVQFSSSFSFINIHTSNSLKIMPPFSAERGSCEADWELKISSLVRCCTVSAVKRLPTASNCVRLQGRTVLRGQPTGRRGSAATSPTVL